MRFNKRKDSDGSMFYESVDGLFSVSYDKGRKKYIGRMTESEDESKWIFADTPDELLSDMRDVFFLTPEIDADALDSIRSEIVTFDDCYTKRNDDLGINLSSHLSRNSADGKDTYAFYVIVTCGYKIDNSEKEFRYSCVGDTPEAPIAKAFDVLKNGEGCSFLTSEGKDWVVSVFPTYIEGKGLVAPSADIKDDSEHDYDDYDEIPFDDEGEDEEKEEDDDWDDFEVEPDDDSSPSLYTEELNGEPSTFDGAKSDEPDSGFEVQKDFSVPYVKIIRKSDGKVVYALNGESANASVDHFANDNSDSDSTLSYDAWLIDQYLHSTADDENIVTADKTDRINVFHNDSKCGEKKHEAGKKQESGRDHKYDVTFYGLEGDYSNAIGFMLPGDPKFYSFNDELFAVSAYQDGNIPFDKAVDKIVQGEPYDWNYLEVYDSGEAVAETLGMRRFRPTQRKEVTLTILGKQPIF